MKRVAKFEKVSYEQFKKDSVDTFKVTRKHYEIIGEVYKRIKTPRRATKFSAGYDIFSPVSFTLEPGESIKIPTGIRCSMNTSWVLMIYPRSGLGFKYRLRLDNTVGIIDSDYYNSDNEGHIFVKLTNEGDKKVSVNIGDAICQGIFVEYGITDNDKVEAERNGGFGSTDVKSVEDALNDFAEGVLK